ncbi:hypothetical protein SD70_26010 [Gordoniibacillus kamchatkensis]|uniref:TOTE conflict system primase domain-containing protein n=1 Tax=Gordoniibacillus kamchatkensis TaxID=1590651 RepID=A0ABR5AC05_9BACL|nr:hypothetical protein [Paenibacillus sp. VKM B-2647]KIL38495.1 hypothetical protein SD70_26010 [Paenibacillus sp. VKM B-2647]
MDNQKIIKKLGDLYIIQRKKYLVQYPRNYVTLTAGEQTKKGKKVTALTDRHLQKHLEGEFTIGTFGGKFKTKFITFDVDFGSNAEMAKWITYKISETLREFGINDHYISYSGNKGYHIDLFFEDLILIEHAKKFFDHILIQSDILQYFDDGQKVEFRPTDAQGVKIPLGVHQKTKKYCGFCLIKDGLKVMDRERSEEYLFYNKR